MKKTFQVDWLLLSPVLILVAISLATLSSINQAYFRTQIISLILALCAFFFFSRINIDILKQFKKPIYITALVLLAINFLIGIESRGAIRWINIFGLSLQFSEILKPFLSICLAAFLSEASHSKVKFFLLTLLFMLPIIALIYLQPDLGSALIYVFVGMFTFLTMGFPLLWFGLLALPFVLSSPFIWLMLHDYQRQRLLTFVHKTNDPLGTSYNSIQAIIAVGSGTFFGKGWFQGTQSTLRFLPERHTDFIFATIAEGLGFVGAAFVVLLFALICYRVYIIFKQADEPFGRIFAICCFGFFLIQGFINIGMNIGFLPIVGVTLPFVSYGGNSLISNFVFLGILTAISNANKTKHVLEIR